MSPSSIGPSGNDPARVDMVCESWADLVARYERDLAHGGVFIETGTALPVFTPIIVRVVPPDQYPPITLPAEVVFVVTVEQAAERKTPPGMGVQTRNLSPEQTTALKDLIKVARRKSGLTTGGGHPAVTDSTLGTVSTLKDHATHVSTDPGRARAISTIRDQLKWFRENDPATSLGVATPVNPDFARKTYFKLCKKYHPDLYTKYNDPELTASVTELFALIRNAYAAALRHTDGGVRPRRPSQGARNR